jgi:microcystin-dependent protein
MTDYTKTTDFAAKDALSTGNPSKIVKGTEIDDELVAISGAVASKADKSSPTFTGTPAAPTASSGTSTTQIATTAFAMGAAALVMPSGALLQWPTATAPTGFLLCTGAAVSRTIYAALFAVIGTTFGAGDGTTTFNLPDFDNRFAVGAGDLYTVGATGGSKDAVVVSHNHNSGVTGSTSLTGSFPTAANTSGNYSGVFSRGSGYSGNGGEPQTNYVVNMDAAHTHTIASEGVSGTNANLPPYLSIYFIIKT